MTERPADAHEPATPAPPSVPRLRTAILGAGRIAGTWAEALRALDERFEWGAVVDPDPAAHGRLGEDVEYHVGTRDLLGAGPPDLAIVCSPPATHESVVTDLLLAGCHVVCEKPLTLNEASAVRMFHTAERAHRMLTMASKFRFVDAVRLAAAMIAAGRIGAPVVYECSFTGSIDMRGRWNSVPRLSGGGVLIDNGAHAVDLARALLGAPISRVLAHFGRRIQPLEVEDTVRVLFEASGSACIGIFDLSWSVPRRDPVYARIQGENGTIELGWKFARWRPHDQEDWLPLDGAASQEACGYDKLAAFRAQLHDVHAAITMGRAPAVGMYEAIDSVRAVDAAYRSAMVGKWVPAGRFGEMRH
jgi:predicted dehydrogenase